MTKANDRVASPLGAWLRDGRRSIRVAQALCLGALAAASGCASAVTDGDAAPDVTTADTVRADVTVSDVVAVDVAAADIVVSDVAVTDATTTPMPVDVTALDSPVEETACACCWSILSGQDCYVIECRPGYDASYGPEGGMSCVGPDDGPSSVMVALTRPTGGWCTSGPRATCPEAGPLEPPELPV
jgi:hypothetical protein